MTLKSPYLLTGVYILSYWGIIVFYMVKNKIAVIIVPNNIR